MPAKVSGLGGIKVVLVSAGDSHSAYLTDTGSVYVSGTFRVCMLYRNYSRLSLIGTRIREYRLRSTRFNSPSLYKRMQVTPDNTNIFRRSPGVPINRVYCIFTVSSVKYGNIIILFRITPVYSGYKMTSPKLRHLSYYITPLTQFLFRRYVLVTITWCC